MIDNKTYSLKDIIKTGLLSGLIALSLSVIGFITLLNKRELVAGILSLGHVFLFSPLIAFEYLSAGRAKGEGKYTILGSGFFIGILTSIPLLILALIEHFFDIRQFLVNVSPDLMEMLLFNQGIVAGSIILMLVMGLVGLLAAGLQTLPENIRGPITYALTWTLLIGTFSEILSGRLSSFFGPQFVKIIFIRTALHPLVAGALLLFFAWLEINQQKRKKRDDVKRPWGNLDPRIKKGLGMLLLLFLPLVLGTYLTEVVNNVGLYVLMGLGLNIVVGFAGLLDLGYVAFFAIGAYVMGILTTQGHLGFVSMSFWTALPFSVGASTLAGIMLGIPVLRMRGDYLAIVTLGFGEIIRILALSDMLKNQFGGAQGILQIPKPNIAGFDLVKPESLFYVILLGVLLALFVSWRLRDSRLGRQWMAMREDEDVAEAMGINLVSTKLLAFATGAAFSGLAGAIFASKLTSIFPHSFNLIVSINVLCLIIVGGIGSLPGVVVGAFILVGLPELLREFAEYRMLIYGALLIIMMLLKPEGFVPSEVAKREMHAHEIQN
jgi:branched-chain amino acid transport system permease protein